MLNSWLEPSITERVEQVGCNIEDNDGEFAQHKEDFHAAYEQLYGQLSEECRSHLSTMESNLTAAINRAVEMAYRAGLSDGLSLQRIIDQTYGTGLQTNP